jgi:hypothetical protein
MPLQRVFNAILLCMRRVRARNRRLIHLSHHWLLSRDNLPLINMALCECDLVF